jgi:hypothetical protein
MSGPPRFETCEPLNATPQTLHLAKVGTRHTLCGLLAHRHSAQPLTAWSGQCVECHLHRKLVQAVYDDYARKA